MKSRENLSLFLNPVTNQIIKKVAFVVIIFISALFLFAKDVQQEQKKISPKPGIYHIPLKKLEYNKFSELECVVEPGLKKTTTVKIFIRNSRERTFKEFPMQYHKGKYFFKIIPEMVQARRLYYFIVAEFSDFSIIAYPSDKPHKKPIRVKLYKKAVKVSKKR